MFTCIRIFIIYTYICIFVFVLVVLASHTVPIVVSIAIVSPAYVYLFIILIFGVLFLFELLNIFIFYVGLYPYLCLIFMFPEECAVAPGLGKAHVEPHVGVLGKLLDTISWRTLLYTYVYLYTHINNTAFDFALS